MSPFAKVTRAEQASSWRNTATSGEKINGHRLDYDSPAIHQAKKNLPRVDVLLEYGAAINDRPKHWAGGFGRCKWARPSPRNGTFMTQAVLIDAEFLGVPRVFSIVAGGEPCGSPALTPFVLTSSICNAYA